MTNFIFLIRFAVEFNISRHGTEADSTEMYEFGFKYALLRGEDENLARLSASAIHFIFLVGKHTGNTVPTYLEPDFKGNEDVENLETTSSLHTSNPEVVNSSQEIGNETFEKKPPEDVLANLRKRKAIQPAAPTTQSTLADDDIVVSDNDIPLFGAMNARKRVKIGSARSLRKLRPPSTAPTTKAPTSSEIALYESTITELKATNKSLTTKVEHLETVIQQQNEQILKLSEEKNH